MWIRRIFNWLKNEIFYRLFNKSKFLDYRKRVSYDKVKEEVCDRLTSILKFIEVNENGNVRFQSIVFPGISPYMGTLADHCNRPGSFMVTFIMDKEDLDQIEKFRKRPLDISGILRLEVGCKVCGKMAKYDVMHMHARSLCISNMNATLDYDLEKAIKSAITEYNNSTSHLVHASMNNVLEELRSIKDDEPTEPVDWEKTRDLINDVLGLE